MIFILGLLPHHWTSFCSWTLASERKGKQRAQTMQNIFGKDQKYTFLRKIFQVNSFIRHLTFKQTFLRIFFTKGTQNKPQNIFGSHKEAQGIPLQTQKKYFSKAHWNHIFLDSGFKVVT